ncbi:MAG TPA: sulfite exporter TauE/SafE family protein [Kofleriaceae bacterium]|nr:sulfite exporter TauE/SafE family protein [Kofleriaceae bacterium]
MDFVVVALVAGLASCLTFFTGFGLGTLLLPAFSLFFPVTTAVALTGTVHLLNGLFKLILVGRNASWRVVVRFGVPGILAAFGGAQVLHWLGDLDPIAQYRLLGRAFDVTPVKLVIAVLMVGFAALELSRRAKNASVSMRWLPVGGLLSGFFGGLSGHQGAFRSAFLLRAGLDKAAFIGTGAVIASMIDLTRLSVYFTGDAFEHVRANVAIVGVGVGTAFVGAYVGSRLLEKTSLRVIEKLVAIVLILVAVALGTGAI